MKIVFICKASTTTGLGHLIRSRTLADKFISRNPGLDISIKIIGEPLVERLLNGVTYDYTIVEKESEIKLDQHYDICFFDLIPMSVGFFKRVRERVDLTVSISPIFEKMAEVDLFFNRTKYHDPSYLFKEGQFHCGLEYNIVSPKCKKIKTSIYEDNLDLEQFPIAIIMGGTDPANKTLSFLKSLKNCKVPATFWVLLGEGYQYSYNELINEIKKDSDHEIILAKTNQSMWQILRNCILAILPGGVTTYEAAYAGMPTINMLEDDKKYYLIQELEEHEICMYAGVFNDKNIDRLNPIIESLYYNRKRLLQMHINSKGLIPDNSTDRILSICKQKLESLKTNKNPV